VTFYPAGKNLRESLPCLTREDVAAFGLKPQLIAKLAWWHQGKCLVSTSIAGMTVQGDLAQAVLIITLPESWLEYRAPDWDPPSRWDEGVAGALLDYNLNMQALELQQEGWGYNMSGNGVTGVNMDAWRLGYAKRFPDTDSQFTFSGYRFSDRDFMTMPDYLTAVTNRVTDNRNK